MAYACCDTPHRLLLRETGEDDVPENETPGQDPTEDQDEEEREEEQDAGGAGDRKAPSKAASNDPPETGKAAAGPAPTVTEKTEPDADYTKRLKHEAMTYRKRATAAETRLRELEEANLSELEKAKRRAQELETELTNARQSARVSQIQAFVAGLGANHPEEVAKLADPEIDDPKLAAQALKERCPHFFKPPTAIASPPSADAGAGRGAPPKSIDDFIRNAVTGGGRGR
jgi:hypothetical protein